MNPDSCKKCGCRCVQVCVWRDYYYCCCWDCFFEGPRGATSDEAVKLWGVRDYPKKENLSIMNEVKEFIRNNFKNTS